MRNVNKTLIRGETIYLRPLANQDATQEYCDWLNDQEVNKYLETRQSTVDDLKQYISKQSADPNSFFAGIFDKKNDKHIGNIKLEPIDWEKKRAIFGILIGDKNYWGKGIGTEATKLIIDYAFNSLGLSEIELGVIAENKRAVAVYEKAGFRAVEIKKQAINHNGVLFDDIIMTIKNNK